MENKTCPKGEMFMKNPSQCPNCKSENIVSTVTYRKAPVIRALKFICIMIFLMIFANNLYEFLSYSAPNIITTQEASAQKNGAAFAVINSNPNIKISAASGFAIIAIILGIIQQWIENKACVLHLCPNCEHSWKDTGHSSLDDAKQ